MYAKFVVYDDESRFNNGRGVSGTDGNKAEEVVPKDVHLFEGKKMFYRKISVSGIKEWDKIVGTTDGFMLLSSMHNMTKDKPFEFILLNIYGDDGPQTYISSEDSTLFIMNESGKTIDRLSCRNDH